jgi:predicted cupin superfamily sugar epimerase
MTCDELIAILNLQPLPLEGGYYRETFRSNQTIGQSGLPARYTSDKSALTSIFYLLTPGVFSALHRLRSDEIYHFYLGDPIELVTIALSGALTRVSLGADILSGDVLQYAVPAGTWQGSMLKEGGQFALLGCTVAPGFDPDDYEHGHWEPLLRQFPDHHATIMKMTRR